MLIRSLGGAAARLVFAAFAIVAFSAGAAEAAFITFVASNGNDANPCTVVTAPCRTLQRAYNVTTANGTIRVLTPLQGNLFIAKSITVEGNGAAIVGFIVINSSTAVVTLRGLALNGGKVLANGIRILSAAAVHIEDCTVERYTNDGIKLVATTATKLFISDTVASASSDGLYADDLYAKVEIVNSHFDQNNSSGAYIKVARASVTGSSASGNASEGFILLGPRVRITETRADDNSANGFSVRSGVVFLFSAEASGNGAAGLHTEGSGDAYVSNSVFAGNLGVDVDNDGAVNTYENNVIGSISGASFFVRSLD